MPTKLTTAIAALLLATSLQAQSAPASQDTPPPPGHGPRMKMVHREMGKWWENPDIASKLQLTDNQVAQLNQTFLDHKMKLIDYGATMQKEDLKLQSLLDADQPNEGQVNTQVDQVLVARGKLEREFTMMNLDLRKVLTVEQWRQLKALRPGAGMGNHVFFYQKFRTGGPDGEPGPPPPPPPGED